MNKKVYIFLLMVLSLPLAIMAQTAVVVDGDHPFFDNFEGTACEWEFVNGESTNAWCWGTATSSGGPHSVYISQDGGETNTYNMSATTWVYFWKLVTLETASYRFTYDWKNLGENNYDYIRVGLLPSSTDPTQGSGLPSGWISLDGDATLSNSSNWTTKSVIRANITEGTYKMVFAWRNDGGSGSNPPGAIDNVKIEKLALDSHTYLVQTYNNDFIMGNGSNVNIADGKVASQYKMASVVDWAATTNLPQNLKGHQVVTWRNYVYCVGGRNSNPVSTVYYATQQTNGISGWTTLNALPQPLQDMAVVTTQTHMIVIGGRNNDTVSDKIYSAAINDDGSIAAWEELSISLPQSCWGARAVEALGNLYIIGGANTDTENDATDKVYRLTVNAIGEVTGITEMNSLPEARNGHAVTVYNSKIIVTGGYDASFTPKNTVYSVAVNLNGNLGTWQTKAALPNAVYGHSTVCTNGIIAVIGGKEGTLESNKFIYTDADATTYNWQLSDIQLPERYTEGAAFAFGNKIFYCGGINLSGNLNNAVRFMAVNPSTTLAGHPVFVSWPFNVGTPKVMDELNYSLTNTTSYTYEILYRTASDENLVFSNWTSAGTNLPVVVNQTKSFIQYMFRITSTGSTAFSIDDVTLTMSGYSQLAGNLNWITELTAENSPYLVTETISFTSGTHNIGPGVTILFMPNTGLNIGAANVNFNGTEANPILLTAYEAGSGSWNGVYYQDASDNSGLSSVMEYTTIEKAGNGENHANLRLYYTNQPSVINHCSFNLSSTDGIWCYCTNYSYSGPTMTDCTFDGNATNGLYLQYNSSPICNSCTMSNNNNGLYMYESYCSPTLDDCTMTGNAFAGINYASNYFGATFTGVTSSDNLYGLYSCTPNHSFTFDESVIAFADNGSDIAMAGGTISSNQTWNYYANGYALLGNVEVFGGTPKLTIVSGNTIKVQQNCCLYVGRYDYQGGMLYAVGTADTPITFTSLNGEVGGWSGLRFRDGSDNSSSSSMRYCVVENATLNLYSEYTNQPSVMWCTFQNATDHNVYLYQASISLEGCTLKDAPRGLSVDYYSNPTVVSTTFENHSEACVRFYNSDNTSVTYAGCTMKNSQYGIWESSPNRDFDFTNTVTFENNVANIAVPYGQINTHTWAASTYAVLDHIWVNNGTLTLSPGTVLKFSENNGYLSIENYGNLIAEGTATQPITFTSLNGEVGGWYGLRFYDGSDYNADQYSSLKHCIFEKANEYNLLVQYTAQPSLIENCIFRNSATKGVYMYDSYNTFNNCTFENNGEYPLYYNNGHFVGELNDLTFTGNLLDGVVVNGGHITVDRTWNAYTYFILNTMHVGRYINDSPNHNRLTLMPGTTIKVAEGKNINIAIDNYCGELYAVGTAEQPITFTSMNGEAGGWNGLVFNGRSDDFENPYSLLKYCVIEKGGSYNLYITGTVLPEIENCVFQNSNGYGLRIDNEYSQTIKNTVIRDNASHGIYVYYNDTPFIVGGSPEYACSIYNNGGYAVYQNSYANNNMTYNFWGNIDAEYIDNNMIYDKQDDSWRGRVTFEPVSWFPVDNFGHLQGTFAYGDNKLMSNRQMNVIDEEENVLVTATTNGNGVFNFSNYAVGVYNTLDNDFGVDILAGVNATDALLVMRHFVHLDTLAYNYATAADVNGSGTINGTDAMLILRRAIDEEFPIGNFYYYNPNGISVEGNTCTYDLSFLCYGDVNGSYTPATRDNSIELMTEGQIVADSYQETELSVNIKNAVEMGALTLRFAYPEEYLEIEDVVLAATGESLIFSANEGMLTTAWFSLEPIALAENDELILVKVRTKDLSNIEEPVVFSLNAYSELADGSAQVLDDVVIAMPAIITETLGMSDNTMDATNLTIYPNPANDICRLSYQLAEAGRVTVSVYNLMGEKVMDGADFHQEEGQHELCLNTSSLAVGMYCCRITFEGENSWTKTTMLIIEK
jgi:parallel beta-helix repeat protein